MSFDLGVTKEILQRFSKGLTLEELEKLVEKNKGSLELFDSQMNYAKLALSIYEEELCRRKGR